MKRLTILYSLVACTMIVYAQPKVSNVEAYPSGKSIAITYDLSEDAEISLYVARNNKKLFKRLPKDYLSGDFGMKVQAGQRRKAYWHVMDEYNNEDFKGYAQFKVKARPYFAPFVLANASVFNTKDWNVGIMAGMCGAAGFYVKGNTNFAANKKVNYTCDRHGYIFGEYCTPMYSGEKYTNNWSITGGGMVRLYIPLYIYAGVGYGQRNLYWETTSHEWVRVRKYGLGFCGDLGLMGNINHFALSFGVSTIAFDYTEFQFGIGYML